MFGRRFWANLAQSSFGIILPPLRLNTKRWPVEYVRTSLLGKSGSELFWDHFAAVPVEYEKVAC